MELEKSKTMENLKDAFIRECSASVKYGFFAEQAKKEQPDGLLFLFYARIISRTRRRKSICHSALLG